MQRFIAHCIFVGFIALLLLITMGMRSKIMSEIIRILIGDIKGIVIINRLNKEILILIVESIDPFSYYYCLQMCVG